MNDVVEGTLLWQPSEERVQRAGLTRFMRWLSEHRGLHFDSYPALWQWSVDEVEAFWAALWEYYAIPHSAPYTQVLAERSMPGTRWFEGARLNYAECMLRHARPGHAAIAFESELVGYTELSWEQLSGQVAALAATLRRMGVVQGDRVVAYLPNIPQTIVALLATASIGAIWSSVSPDMGHVSVIDRFRQIEPTVLLAVDGYRYGGRDFDRRGVVGEIAAALPSLRHVILVPYLDPAARPDAFVGGTLWQDAIATPAALEFAQVPFDHPLWVVYSSGTTGMPKPIVHGHGGTVIEAMKGSDLHLDVGPDDRFLWFSSTNWIVWNLLVNTLNVGCTVLQFDGNPGHPDMSRLWRFAERAGATFFGASAAYISQCMKAGLEPRAVADLSRIRSIGSTGSPLPVQAYRWVYDHINADILLASISGGTDPGAAFVGACAILPQYAGEMQCRCLGAAIAAYDDAGEPLVDAVGELVCTLPMPSFPLYFWNDPGGRRYFESYFDTYPGVWRHGDWIKITPRGGAIIYGRSDSTINRHGIRMGSAEIYRVVEAVPEVADSLVVDLEYLGRESWMPLFVVLREGAVLNDELVQRIRSRVRTDLSGRHVPDDIYAIPEVPRTLNGKKLEVPIKRLLLGHPLEKIINQDSMSNPGSLRWFIDFAARR